MAEPRVPGQGGETLRLPCGESVRLHDIDLGMRSFDCACGGAHGVVTDVHPPERFLPAFLVETLREVVETVDADALGEFGTPHLLGLVLEEFPGEVVVADASEDGHVGYAMVWVTSFDDRRLHEVVVELVIELMEHAMSHAADEDAMAAFEEEMFTFDVATFVEQYRSERDWTAADVAGYDGG